jgi:acetyl-CoA C-acetyltransferase
MKKVYIHNPQLSKFGKTLDSVQSLSVKTAKKTLESFDKQTDLFVFSSFAPEVYTKEFHLAALESDAGGFSPRGFSFESDTSVFKTY